MRYIKLSGLILGIFFPHFAMAAPISDDALKRRCDVDQNGFLSGPEIENLALAIASPAFRGLDLNCDGSISTSEQGQNSPDVVRQDINFLAARTDLDKQAGDNGQIEVPEVSGPRPELGYPNFYIAKDVFDTSINTFTNGSTERRNLTGDKGAVFSFTDDRENNIETRQVDLTLLYAKSFLEITGGDPSNPSVLTAKTGGVYLDVESTTKTGSPDKSSLKLGGIMNWELNPEGPGLHYLSFSPFIQTDLDFGAEIYGATAQWQPVLTDWGLNAGPMGPYALEFSLDAEYLNVNKPGETGIKSNEHLFVGGTLGVEIFPLLNTSVRESISIKGAVDYRRDMLTDANATLLTASVGSYIDEAKKIRAELSYKQGKEYLTTNKVDQFDFSFRFAY